MFWGIFKASVETPLLPKALPSAWRKTQENRDPSLFCHSPSDYLHLSCLVPPPACWRFTSSRNSFKFSQWKAFYKPLLLFYKQKMYHKRFIKVIWIKTSPCSIFLPLVYFPQPLCWTVLCYPYTSQILPSFPCQSFFTALTFSSLPEQSLNHARLKQRNHLCDSYHFSSFRIELYRNI